MINKALDGLSCLVPMMILIIVIALLGLLGGKSKIVPENLYQDNPDCIVGGGPPGC